MTHSNAISNRTHDSFVFEVTQRCNHDCPHCYNCWKNDVDYPDGELDTADTLDMLVRMIDQTGASMVTLTGGEPFLRDDIYEIVDCLSGLGVTTNMICNGSLITEESIAKMAGKISIYELPLLSVEREIHDRLSGRVGAFDDVTMALANLKAASERVVTVFVATKLNLPLWTETAELAIALGADGIMFNRFNPGGTGGQNIELLQATPAELTEAMDAADQMSQEYEISISCSIAMPPCLFDHSRYKKLTFGYCAAGTDRAYYTLDPLGNVRPCNHSTTIIGNIREGDFWEMVDSATMKDFFNARPEFCAGCKLEDECLGCCKAAAEVCCGSAWQLDPFVKAFSSQAVKLT
ncbi:MAG: radical SAM protein [bacterium]|nr:radical SAM protein [bacterium]